jgi:KipI family sensor histidine kinase inhibitor
MVYFADEVGEEGFRRGRAVTAALERRPPPGLREYVVSFTSVLLEFLPGHDPDGDSVVAALREAASSTAGAPPSPKVIRVRYEGPDLGRVAEHAGLSEREVIEVHAGGLYRVYSLGFAPGFPYLGDLDPRLRVPRLATPRLQVPAGSVAIGGEHTGIYPVASPGGWNLIGRTETRLFAPDAPDEAKFFLKAGDLVRFEPE